MFKYFWKGLCLAVIGFGVLDTIDKAIAKHYDYKVIECICAAIVWEGDEENEETE